ncbi:MAG: hypothetical protein Q8P62_04735 [Candidatus Peregrinibacteria bacterium]|nr:hypothetical protein [Candidatus Peregrinibacteria bacterium]
MIKTALASLIIGDPLSIACPAFGGNIFTITIFGVSCGVAMH